MADVPMSDAESRPQDGNHHGENELTQAHNTIATTNEPGIIKQEGNVVERPLHCAPGEDEAETLNIANRGQCITGPVQMLQTPTINADWATEMSPALGPNHSQFQNIQGSAKPLAGTGNDLYFPLFLMSIQVTDQELLAIKIRNRWASMGQ